MRQRWRTVGPAVAVVSAAVLATAVLAGCGPSSAGAQTTPSSTATSTAGGATAPSSPSTQVDQPTGAPTGGSTNSSTPTPTPSPTPTYPSGPPLQIDSIVPVDGQTVGVAMPISINFTHDVAKSARKALEQHLHVLSSKPVVGAWHWFSDTRVDFRPQSYWSAGMKVKLDAELDHVGDGNGRYGTHSYTHTFTIGRDLQTKISVPDHTTKVYKDGKLLKTMPSDAGSPDFTTWNGTMAVIDTNPNQHMTSCSVHIACKKGEPNFYDDYYPWAVRLTWSGTFVHYSDGDPYPGDGNGSHGCVHLSYRNAKWFYNISIVGDPVTITGSKSAPVSADNGYNAFQDTWTKWLSTSYAGQVTTTAL